VTAAAPRPARPGPPRPHFTGRAAVLAVVLCAIALSLAYPVREYLAQVRQIGLLKAQGQQISLRLKRLEHEQARLRSASYVEWQARDRLHMCFPSQQCFVIIDPLTRPSRSGAARQSATPWYARLWSSVRLANAGPGGGGGKGPQSRRDGADRAGRAG
jgi:cell division protein FtsB